MGTGNSETLVEHQALSDFFVIAHFHNDMDDFGYALGKSFLPHRSVVERYPYSPGAQHEKERADIYENLIMRYLEEGNPIQPVIEGMIAWRAASGNYTAYARERREQRDIFGRRGKIRVDLVRPEEVKDSHRAEFNDLSAYEQAKEVGERIFIFSNEIARLHSMRWSVENAKKKAELASSSLAAKIFPPRRNFFDNQVTEFSMASDRLKTMIMRYVLQLDILPLLATELAGDTPQQRIAFMKGVLKGYFPKYEITE